MEKNNDEQQMTEEESTLRTYQYALCTIINREEVDLGYNYTIHVDGTVENIVLFSDHLFSTGEIVLLIEIEDGWTIMIDLS